MKKWVFVLFLFLSISVFSQTEHQILFQSKISNITVFIDGAELTESYDLNLVKGRNLVVVKNVSNKLMSNTIRVITENTVNVLSISSKIDYLQQESEKPRIKILKDSLLLVNRQLKDFTDLTNAYTIEKELLIKNMSLSGANNGVAVNELKSASAFYREKILEINKKLTEFELESLKLDKTKTQIDAELLELNANSSYSIYEIYILLSSEEAKKTSIEMKYLVSNAGWSPTYDLKVSDINTDIDVNYRAQVYNDTDIDWKDVKLKLSSGDPSISAESPVLKPWHVNYVDYNNFYGGINKQTKSDFIRAEGYTQNMIVPNISEQSVIEISDNIAENDYIEVEVSQLSIEFDIAEKYSIPSDNKPYYVEVAEYKLPAIYKHFCVPKMEKDVFLLARITGWQDLNLVEGTAHVYFAGAYVGESYIYTRNVRDTLDLSLGRDKKVIVTRSKLKEYSSVKLIGAKRKETLAYQMIVKNNRNQPIDIEIQDQLPISTNSEIEIDVIQTSNAKQDVNSGKLVWEYHVKSGEAKTIDLQFAIKYPKNSTIQIEQSKTKRMRQF